MMPSSFRRRYTKVPATPTIAPRKKPAVPLFIDELYPHLGSTHSKRPADPDGICGPRFPSSYGLMKRKADARVGLPVTVQMISTPIFLETGIAVMSQVTVLCPAGMNTVLGIET